MGLDDLVNKANATLEKNKTLVAIGSYFKVRPIVIAGVIAAVCFLFVFYGFCGALVCTLAGLGYPVLESYKAVEASDKVEINFWLSYWVVYAGIHVCENCLYYVLIWFPFYFPLKLAFLGWLGGPTRGALNIYNTFVSPFLKRNQSHIDKAIDEVSKETKRSLSNLPGQIKHGAVVGAHATKRSMSGLQDLVVTSSASLKKSASGMMKPTESDKNKTPEELFKESSTVAE